MYVKKQKQKLWLENWEMLQNHKHVTIKIHNLILVAVQWALICMIFVYLYKICQ